jgi:hypothetical protein
MTKGEAELPLRLDAMDDEQQVPPLRFASVGMTPLFISDKELGMTKGEGGASIEIRCSGDEQQVLPLRSVSVGSCDFISFAFSL